MTRSARISTSESSTSSCYLNAQPPIRFNITPDGTALLSFQKKTLMQHNGQNIWVRDVSYNLFVVRGSNWSHTGSLRRVVFRKSTSRQVLSSSNGALQSLYRSQTRMSPLIMAHRPILCWITFTSTPSTNIPSRRTIWSAAGIPIHATSFRRKEISCGG